MWPFRNISLPYVSLLTKQSEISTKPYGLSRGETSPCCYDSEWSEITARGDHGATPC